MSFIQVGDAIVLGKFALDLYQKVFLVAKAAPETFGKLLRELIIVKNVLYRIDNRFRREGRQQYDEDTQAALMLCNEALLTFKPLVIKYKKLASANGSSLRQKLKFPFDQSKIRTAREELQKAINILNLGLTAEAALGPTDPPSPQARTHRTRQPTVEDVDDSESTIGQRPGPRGLLLSTQDRQDPLRDILRGRRADSLEAVPEPFRPVGRVQTLDTNADEHLMPTAAETAQNSNRHSTDSSIRSHRSRSSFNSVASASATSRVIPLSPLSHANENIDRLYGDYFHTFQFSPSSQAVADNDESSIQENDQHIEIDSEDRDEIVEKLDKHPAFRQLEKKFEVEAKQLKKPTTHLEEWLACAIWWLLKSRKITEVIHTDLSTPSQDRTVWPIKISQEQAAVDLLKACFIVRNIVFSKENTGRAVKNSVWKSAQDLISAVHDEILKYDTINILNEYNQDLERLSMGFSERVHQPVETLMQLPAALDSFQLTRRWLTVHMDHAGDSGEKVLFRTFVNAQIGDERERRKSPSAPYLLVLWSQHGRSEVIVSLANQLGTVSLCCTLTDQDLQRHEEHTKSSLEFDIKFPSQDAVVQFLNPSELQEFLEYPKNFFDATSEREAKPEEFLVFREGLQHFDQRSSTQGPRSSISGGTVTQAHSSCEVSLYEIIPSECWKTQRRLVVTSALDVTRPWCYSYWLPISKIRVHGEGRDVELHWSNCNQLEKKSNGYYGVDYSLIHKPESPNVNVNFQFQDSNAASEFKASILRPWVVPFETDSLKCKFSFGSAGGIDDSPSSAPVGQELSIWQLMDAEGDKRQIYLSIVHVNRTYQSGFVTNVYFVHRDVDFAVERTIKNSVSFEGLRIPHPVSDVVKVKYPPKVEGTCADVVWVPATADFHFENDGDITRFIKSLTNWELVFCCRASSMQSGATVSPGSWRQRDVTITVWTPSSDDGANRSLRIAGRWMGDVQGNKDFRWTAAVISSSTVCNTSGTTKVVLKDVNISRGAQLDIKTLAAVDLQGRVEEQRRRTLELTLPDAVAAQQLQHYVTKIKNPSWSLSNSSVLYRPDSFVSGTTDSKSSNDASKFLR